MEHAPVWCGRPRVSAGNLPERYRTLVLGPTAFTPTATGQAGGVTETTDVTHHPERSRFETGQAYLSYVRNGDTFDLQHTIVPPEMGGKGVGGALVRAAIGYARAEGLQLIVTCPFAKSWLEKHPDA